MNQQKHTSNLDHGRGLPNPEYQRHLDILSGLPGLGDYEQRAEIGDRMARGELVQVNEIWYERVDLSPAEARPHDDEPVLGDVIKCQQCGRQTRSVSRGCSVCGVGKPSDDAPASLPGVVYVVEGEETGVLYGAYDPNRAKGWIDTEGRESWGSSLAVTALAVDRG